MDKYYQFCPIEARKQLADMYIFDPKHPEMRFIIQTETPYYYATFIALEETDLDWKHKSYPPSDYQPCKKYEYISSLQTELSDGT